MIGLEAAQLPLILDGALGTELERRGFDARPPLWSTWALIEQPDLIKQIHIDYVNAGADILTTATFRTTRYALAKVGMANRSRELTRLAVTLAHEAALEAGPSRRVFVAGSIAPLEDCYHPEHTPGDAVLIPEFTHAAGQLADAGVDIVLVETQNSSREAQVTAAAAMMVGRPVWVSLMPRSDRELFNGESLRETAVALRSQGVAAILLNCCPPSVARAAFRSLLKALPGLKLGVYPNFSSPEGDPWHFNAIPSPDGFAEWARPMLADAAVIGACCGSRPEHIAALTKLIQGAKANR